MVTNISNDSSEVSITLAVPFTDAIIEGATPGLSYTVQVAASNPVGLGPFTTSAFGQEITFKLA